MSTQRRTLGVWSRKRPLGPNGEKICYNCGGPLPKGRAYNCSPKCSEEWRCKTSPSHMRFLLWKRDHGVCASCGLDTDALQKEYHRLMGVWKSDGSVLRGTFYAQCQEWTKAHGIPYGRTVSDWWDADHITPVIEGGGECGLENYRTLCIPCHKKVSAELRGRMAAKARTERQQAARRVLSQPLEFGKREQIVQAAKVLRQAR